MARWNTTSIHWATWHQVNDSAACHLQKDPQSLHQWWYPARHESIWILENQNGFDPNNLPLSWHIGTSSVVTYCWSKRSIPFTFWPRMVSPGCGEEGNGTTGLMGIPAQGHRHKGVLLQANRSEGALRQVRQALQGPGNWCYKKAMGISQLCCFSYHSKHLVVNFQLTIASLWFFQERSWCQPPRFHHFIGYKGNWNF